MVGGEQTEQTEQEYRGSRQHLRGGRVLPAPETRRRLLPAVMSIGEHVDFGSVRELLLDFVNTFRTLTEGHRGLIIAVCLTLACLLGTAVTVEYMRSRDEDAQAGSTAPAMCIGSRVRVVGQAAKIRMGSDLWSELPPSGARTFIEVGEEFAVLEVAHVESR